MTAPVMMVMQMPMVVIMADRAAAVQSAIRVALSSPKAALAHIGWMRFERWLKTLSSPELWCIREVLVDESRPGVPPRLMECIAANGARRAAGDLEPGARHLLDPATLAFFARCNGFPRTPAWLYLLDWDELVAADLLWRYGWTASEAGLTFDDWKPEHRQEMLEVMKQISSISGAPTTGGMMHPPILPHCEVHDSIRGSSSDAGVDEAAVHTTE
jgi:hypothetical protein